MSHLEKRKDRYYATLPIPKDVREEFGKFKFFKTTGTGDKRKAQIEANRLVVGWQAEIEAARKRVASGVSEIDLAFAMQDQLRAAGQAGDHHTITEYDHLKMVIEDLVRDKAKQGRHKEAGLIRNITLDSKEPISIHLDEWEMQLHVKPKNIERMRKDAELFAEHFHFITDVTTLAAREWAKSLQRKGKTISAIEKAFTAARSLWSYLQEIGKAPDDLKPLDTPQFIKREKQKNGKDSWIPFTPEEVVKLYRESLKKGDQQLADLIELGMYTGARINELCHLKVKECTQEVLRITDSKTDAGIREVPVHSQLKKTVQRLLASSRDGYLLSGLSFNKYDSRSDAIGKRFGRLKNALGFQKLKVFHSIRKTVTTMLENAGISENLTADIIGHDKPRLTYGLYSGGHNLERKLVAIELIQY